MPKGEVPYYCGGCGKSRDRDVNHWMVILPDTRKGQRGLGIYGWHKVLAGTREAEYACGSNCVSILFARWLSTGSLTEAKTLEVK